MGVDDAVNPLTNSSVWIDITTAEIPCLFYFSFSLIMGSYVR